MSRVPATVVTGSLGAGKTTLIRRETAARLLEALERGLWKPKSNSAGALLAELRETHA